MIEGILLPRLILIGNHFTDGRAQTAILDAVRAGVRWVHLRDHEASDYAFESAATVLLERIKGLSLETMVSINTRLSVAREHVTHFHTGGLGPAVDHARQMLGPTAVVGFSAHDEQEGEDALARGADYLLYSPVFDTGEKPGLGMESLRAVCRSFAWRLPVYALGGITPERTADCLDAGAFGVAVLSGILSAPDPAEAVAAYREAIEGRPMNS